MTLVKSRAAKLLEIVPGAVDKCVTCNRKVGARFYALYTGTPADKQLVGWVCSRCGTVHVLDGE